MRQTSVVVFCLSLWSGSAVGETGVEDLLAKCVPLLQDTARYEGWNSNGGWEVARKWEALTANRSVTLRRLATFKADWPKKAADATTESREPELSVECDATGPSVEFTFASAVVKRPRKVSVVLKWDDEGPRLDSKWTGSGDGAWPGPLTGEKGQFEIVKRIFDSSALSICIMNSKGAPMVEHFDLKGIGERGAEIRRECGIP